MKKLIGGIAALGLCFLLIFYIGRQANRTQANGSVEVKEDTRTIAIVNMDQGIRLDQGVMNYGTQMLGLIINKHFYSTSLEDARSGIGTGKFAAYIIVPADFSEKVWSINTIPEKSVLEYAINPNLQESVALDVLYDVKGFEMALNTDISYLYLYSILQEFHTGQASAETIMKNDKKDMENLAAVDPEKLLQPLEFTELQPLAEYPEDVDLNTGYQNLNNIMEEFGNQYNTYISWADDDLNAILRRGQTVIDAMDGFHVTISDIDLLNDEDGRPVYEDGKVAFFKELAQYNTALEEERATLTGKFQWLARHDSVATASDATPSEAERNTWLDEIRVEHERQREEYNQSLAVWKESFDYSKLATPSEASPSDATPSDATPSEAMPSAATPSAATPSEPNPEWLRERDYHMVTLVMNGVYDQLEDGLDDLDLDEDQLDEVKWLVWQTFNDEELVKPIVASASNASPVSGNPEAGQYIKEYLDSMPQYEGSLTDELDTINGKVADFCTEQTEYLAGCAPVPINELDQMYESGFIQKLGAQEVYLQGLLGKELDTFGDTFNDFSKALQDYRPLHPWDQENLDGIQSNLQDSISGLQDHVNDQTGADREYISTLEENQRKDIDALEKSLDVSYEGTSKNLEGALNQAKDSRKQLNQGNEALLTDFTKKLPYTKNGSVAATDTYDVIANPVTFEEKAVQKKPFTINGKEVHMGREGIFGVSIAVIVILLAQNAHLRRKNKRLREDSER